MAKLEEDAKIGETPLDANPAIIEPLKQYVALVVHIDVPNPNRYPTSELQAIIEWLCESDPKGKSIITRTLDVDHNKGEIVQRTREIDDAFQRYTASRVL